MNRLNRRRHVPTANAWPTLEAFACTATICGYATLTADVSPPTETRPTVLAADVNAVQQLLGWLVVLTTVGCWVIWRVYEVRKPRRERFEAEWQRRFEPNRQWVPEHRQWTEADAQAKIDADYVRLMQELPDDHLPSDWRKWGNKAGARKARR